MIIFMKMNQDSQCYADEAISRMGDTFMILVTKVGLGLQRSIFKEFDD